MQGMDRYYYYYQIYVPNNDIIPAIQQPATQPYYSSLRPGGRSTRRRGHHSACPGPDHSSHFTVDLLEMNRQQVCDTMYTIIVL